MTPSELFALIGAALRDVPMDLETVQGKRLYLAYLAARHGAGDDSRIDERITELREELGI